MSLYDDLGVPKDATPDDIKKAYRKAAMEHHPDRAGGDSNKFALVQRAYDVLGDAEKRQRYDETGQTQEPASIEAEAREGLLNLFSQALQQEGNCVEIVRAAIRGAKSNQAAMRADTQRQIRKLEKRSGKIRVKQGTNLVQGLIDQQIGNLKKRLAMLDHEGQVADAAAAMLEHYEEDIPPPAPPTPTGGPIYQTHAAFGPDFFRP